MRKLFIVFFCAIVFFECYGQRYEVWIKTTGNHYEVRKNLGYFNDSILTIYTNPKLFVLSKDIDLKWDDIDEIKIRNKSRNQFGALLGLGVGIIAGSAWIKSYTKQDVGNPFAPMLITIGTIGGGSLAGHLLTSAKISIPLNGKTAKEKSQALRNKIKK